MRTVLRILVLFFLVTPFWSLFDQKASTWVLQADAMTKPAWFKPSQMQALNPLLVMLLIPFNNLVLYPALRRGGLEPTALRRMTAGHRLLRASWIVVGVMQLALDGGNALSPSSGRCCRTRCSRSARCWSRRPASSSPTARRRRR